MIRPAVPTDVPTIAALIRALAEYEHLAHEVVLDEVVLGEHLFGPRPAAEVLIAEPDDATGTAVGFALFFHNFSTFLGRPGIYLEDLFVHPEHRGRGLGRALLAELGRLAQRARLRSHRVGGPRLERAFHRLLPLARCPSAGGMDAVPPDRRRDARAGRSGHERRSLAPIPGAARTSRRRAGYQPDARAGVCGVRSVVALFAGGEVDPRALALRLDDRSVGRRPEGHEELGAGADRGAVAAVGNGAHEHRGPRAAGGDDRASGDEHRRARRGAVVVVVVGDGGGGSVAGGVSSVPDPPAPPERPDGADRRLPPVFGAQPPGPVVPSAVEPSEGPVDPAVRGSPVRGSITVTGVSERLADPPGLAASRPAPALAESFPARSSDRRIAWRVTIGGRSVTSAATRSTALQATPHAPSVAIDHTPNAADFLTASLSPDSGPDLVKRSSRLPGALVSTRSVWRSWSRCS